MKKIFCLLVGVLFLFPLTAEALREPDHIGIEKAQETTSGLIVRGDAKIWMVTLTATTGPNHLTLYDDYNAPAEANIIMEIEVATAGNSEVVVLKYPIDVSNGLYAVTGGNDATYIILYEQF